MEMTTGSAKALLDQVDSASPVADEGGLSANQLLQNSPLPSILVDEKLGLQYANPVAEQVLFLSRSSGAGRYDLKFNTYITSPLGGFLDWLQGDSDRGLEVSLSAGYQSQFIAYRKTLWQGDQKYYFLVFCSRDDVLYLNRHINIYKAAFRFSRQATYITDLRGRVITINPACIELLGYASQEIVGRNHERLYDGDCLEMIRDSIVQAVQETDHWQGQVEIVNRQGCRCSAKLVVVAVEESEQAGTGQLLVWMLENIEDQLQRERALQRSAETDALTGLFNRTGFNRYFHDSFSEARRTGEGLTLLFLDLDNFKTLNDQHGHQCGDELLVGVSRRLRHNLKQSDFVARMGGDEFVVLIRGRLDNAAIRVVAEKLVAALGAPYGLGNRTRYCSVSIGIACYPDDAMSDDALLQAADKAMYQAKKAGRNGYCLASEAAVGPDG